MRLHHFLLAILIVAIWGFNFVVIKIGLHEIPPFLLNAIRFFLGCFPLLFFVKKPSLSLTQVFLYSMVMYIMQFSFMFISMKVGMTAGMASLLLQVQVFFIILLAIIFLAEQPHICQLFGAFVSFLGIGEVIEHLGETISPFAFVMMMAAAISLGVGNLILKKIGKINMFSLVVWGSSFAWLPFLGLSFVFDGADKIYQSMHNISFISIAAIFYLVYPATLFGFAAWGWLLSEYDVIKVAPFALLVPVFGMFSSVLVLNEPLQIWKIIAAVLVISGLCINLCMHKLFLEKNIK